jgi:hypothetical protein
LLLEKDIYFAAAKTGNVDTLEESKVSVTTVDEFGTKIEFLITNK